MQKITLCLLSVMFAFYAAMAQPQASISKPTTMKIEIWSDVMCPFCYIGKRKLEAALQTFEHRDKIEIEWKSYQLQPDLVTDPGKNALEHLAESKGWSMAYTKQVTAQVSQMAASVGLTFDFSKAVVANSMDAHRLLHFANNYGKANALGELLFKAYFTDGKNIADHSTLTALAVQAGLPQAETLAMLQSTQYTDAVRQDIYEAAQLRVGGVPFFVFDNKFAISGAQETAAFQQTLIKAFAEWQQKQPATLTIQEGAVCKPSGECK